MPIHINLNNRLIHKMPSHADLDETIQWVQDNILLTSVGAKDAVYITEGPIEEDNILAWSTDIASDQEWFFEYSEDYRYDD